MPEVSVIVPVYNVAKYLRQCMDSLVGQTLRDIEIICVDDGSTDGSGPILDEYAAKDSRIRVIHQANAGAGAARNVGLDMATGEYLFFCDPDDWFLKGMLKAMYRRAMRTRADIAIAGRMFFDDQTGRRIGLRGFRPEFWLRAQPFSPNEIADRLFTMSPTVVWDKLFRRAHIQGKGLRFQQIRCYNDLYFTNVALATADRIALVWGAWACYRQNRAGSLQLTKDKSPECCFTAFDAVRDRLRSEGTLDRFRLALLDAIEGSGIYNLRTLKARESKMRYLELLKQHVAQLRSELSDTDLARIKRTIGRTEMILSAVSPEDIRGERKSGPPIKYWLKEILPFRMQEALKIMRYLLGGAHD